MLDKFIRFWPHFAVDLFFKHNNMVTTFLYHDFYFCHSSVRLSLENTGHFPGTINWPQQIATHFQASASKFSSKVLFFYYINSNTHFIWWIYCFWLHTLKCLVFLIKFTQHRFSNLICIYSLTVSKSHLFCCCFCLKQIDCYSANSTVVDPCL